MPPGTRLSSRRRSAQANYATVFDAWNKAGRDEAPLFTQLLYLEARAELYASARFTPDRRARPWRRRR